MEDNQPACEAVRRLREGGVSDKALYGTVLLATGDEDAASAALTARVGAKLAAGEKPDLY